MAPPFDKNAYPPFMIRVSGPTIGRRIHTSLSAGGNARCSASNPLDPLNASSRSTPQCRTSSPSNVTFYPAPSLSSFGLTHSRIGRAVLCLAERADVAGSLVLTDLTCQCLLNFRNQRRAVSFETIRPSLKDLDSLLSNDFLQRSSLEMELLLTDAR